MSTRQRQRTGIAVVGASLLLLLGLVLLFGSSVQSQSTDGDGDGVDDSVDNCVVVSNPGQQDANSGEDDDSSIAGVQHYGDACDPDIDNDGLVSSVDFFSGFRPCLGLDVAGNPGCATSDFDSDGIVSASDFFNVFRPALNGAPGPGVTEADPQFEGVTCDDMTPTSECVVTVRGIQFVTTRDKITTLAGAGAGGPGGGADPSPGIMVMDDLRLLTPFGEVAFLEAVLSFTVGSGGIGPFESVVGTTRVPFPDIGFLAGAQVDETPMATLGLDIGANIDVGVPLQPDRDYLFFQFGTSFGASLGPISFGVGGPGATFVLDPFDPFFFVGGSLAGLFPGATSDDPDFGFGASLQTLIPFSPVRQCNLCDHDFRETGTALDASCAPCVAEVCAADSFCCNNGWDQTCVNLVQNCAEPDPGSFNGNLLLRGPLPIGTLPLTLDGVTVGSVDPNNDGTIFQGSTDLALGANAAVAVTVPFFSFLEFGFDLGDGSAIIEFDPLDETIACFNGVLDPQDPFAMFPPAFPIPIRQAPGGVGAQVVGSFNAPDVLSSFIKAEGEFSIDLGPLGAPIGVNLGEMASASASLSLDSNGLFFSGMTQTQVIPNFTNSEMSLDVQIPTSDPLLTFAELQGALTVAGVGLDPARIAIGVSSGFEVEGTLDLSPVAVLAVDGGVDASGVMLTGTFDVDISFNLQTQINDVVAAAQLAVDFAQGLLDDCKDLCPGDCYANPCCIACDATLGAAVVTAQLALDAVQAAADLFFGALPFPIAGDILVDVDVMIDNIDISGSVAASFFGLNLGGRAMFFPPQVCVTLPLGIFPGASELGLGDAEFCLPPF